MIGMIAMILFPLLYFFIGTIDDKFFVKYCIYFRKKKKNLAKKKKKKERFIREEKLQMDLVWLINANCGKVFWI